MMNATGSSVMSVPFTTLHGIISQDINLSQTKSKVTIPALSTVRQETGGLQAVKQITQQKYI
jgi:hypothetical protein